MGLLRSTKPALLRLKKINTIVRWMLCARIMRSTNSTSKSMICAESSSNLLLRRYLSTRTNLPSSRKKQPNSTSETSSKLSRRRSSSWKTRQKLSRQSQTGQQEPKREKTENRLKRKRRPLSGGLAPPLSIFATLECCPLIFPMLREHLRALTLRHMLRLLLRRLLRNIMRFLYAVFQDVLDKPPAVLSSLLYVKPAIVEVSVFSLFIILLSKIRLKTLMNCHLVLD